MKKILLSITALLFCLLFFTSCAVNQALLYEDQFDELDISGRFNELAYSVERKETATFLYKQANTIIEDLESIHPAGDETLEKINNDFIIVAQTLIQAMDHTKAHNSPAFSACYTAAKKLYNTTNKRLNQYKNKNWSTPDDN